MLDLTEGVLSQRQHDVLRLVAQGMTRKEVARELGIQPHTAADHAAAMRATLGAKTLAHAVAIGAKRGIL